MKKSLLLALSLVVVLALGLVSCSKSNSSSTPAEPTFSIALVTDRGSIDDKSFNQGTWEGVLRFADETGADTSSMQSHSDADYIPNLSTLSEAGHDLVVAPSFLFVDPLTQIADNYPSQKFLLIDAIIDRPNVASAVFSEEEGSFLVGAAAASEALKAGKNSVGFVGGGSFPLIWSFEAGFEAGAKAVSPDMIVLTDYIGDFVDAGKGQSIASKMFDEGAFAVYHAAGNGGNGVIKEAKDRRINGQNVWAVGVDRDQYDDGIYAEGESAILVSMMKRVDIASYTVAKLTKEGNFPGGETIYFSLENGGVSLPENNPNLSAETLTLVDDLKAKVIAGEIEVPSLPSNRQ